MTLWTLARTLSIGVGVIGIGVVLVAFAWILWDEVFRARSEELY